MFTKTEAAFQILKTHKKPMRVKEIIHIALEKRMIVTHGKTPESTMAADLYTENKRRTKRGTDLRFVQLGKGMWGLVEWGLKPVEVNKPKSKRK